MVHAPSPPLGHMHLTPDDMNTMMTELQDPTHTLPLTAPQDALVTYSGRLVEIRHAITAEWETSGCCTTDPTLGMRILQITEPSSGMHSNTHTTTTTTTSNSASTSVQTAPLTHMPSSSAMLGNTNSSNNNTPEGAESNSNVGDTNASPPSVARLLQDMNNSAMPAELVEQRTRDSTWRPLFQSLSPTDYAQIVKCVTSEWDQVTVATSMARGIPSFSCDHVVAALGSIAEWNRTRIVESLLPFVHDFAQHGTRIEEALSEWDRMLTSSAFAQARAKQASS
jgi:hypothetical protein